MADVKINGLTGTRAIAAILVVVHHYGSNLFPFKYFGSFFSNGNLAVGYFFVLSGFVLFISDRKVSYFSFMRKRFLRIAPAYYFALLFTVLTLFFLYPPLETNVTEEIICSSLFLQAFFQKYVLELNSPGWSVSVEIFFYCLFPLLMYFSNKKNMLFIFSLTIFIASQIIHVYYAPKIWALSGSGIYFNPLMHLNQFLIGMSGGYLYANYPTLAKQRFLPIIVLAIVILLVVYRPEQVSFQAGLIAPIFMLLIVSIASNHISWLQLPALVFLGEISYGIYIYQFSVFKCLYKINDIILHVNNISIFYISIIVLLFVAGLSYVLVEKPLNNRIKQGATTSS